MSSEYQIGHEGEFTFRGHTLDELQAMELDEVAELLPARQRRSIKRGLTEEKQKLLEKARDADEEETANNPIRTNLRNMPVVPAMVGITFAVNIGQAFDRVNVEP